MFLKCYKNGQTYIANSLSKLRVNADLTVGDDSVVTMADLVGEGHEVFGEVESVRLRRRLVRQLAPPRDHDRGFGIVPLFGETYWTDVI